MRDWHPDRVSLKLGPDSAPPDITGSGSTSASRRQPLGRGGSRRYLYIALAAVGGYFLLRVLHLLLILLVLTLIGDQEGVAIVASNWSEATVYYNVEVSTFASTDKPVAPKHLLVLVPVPEIDGRLIPDLTRAVEQGTEYSNPRQLVQKEQGTFMPVTEADLVSYDAASFFARAGSGKRPMSLLFFDTHLARRFSLSAATPDAAANWIYVESDVPIRYVRIWTSLESGGFSHGDKTLILLNPANGWNLCKEGRAPQGG